MADTITNIIGKDVRLYDNGDGTHSLAIKSAGGDVEVTGIVAIDQVTAGANEVVTKEGSVTNATLQEGEAVVGKFGIDQTTDGTTNKVQARNSSHDDFSANANLQIADADVGDANPVPIKPLVKTTYATTSLSASGVIKESAGTLYGISGINNSSNDQYLQIFNSDTVPADATVPTLVLFIPANSNFSFDLGDYGYPFATGISWSSSSTLATKTIGSADVWLNGIYD